MKAIKKKLTVLVMALVLAVTGTAAVGGVGRDKPSEANALSSDYLAGFDTVYYFSDSAPLYREYAFLEEYNTVYDTWYYLTPQALAYMLYSGYFWGFENGHDRTIVIVELKAMTPDQETLNNLFDCLHAQDCKVLFISPYIDTLGEVRADVTMPCNPDKFYLYLKNSVKAMSDVGGDIYADTTLLIDGRMVNVYNNDYDMIDGYINSANLRVLLLNMFYGCDNYNEIYYERELYIELWGVYCELVLDKYAHRLDYFNGQTNIDDYLRIWEELERDNPELLNDIWRGYNEEYNTRCKDEVSKYFKETLARGFDNKNIHIIAYTDIGLYIDIIYTVFEEAFEQCVYVFADYVEFFNSIRFNINYLYGMGYWRLDQSFYSLLSSIQDNLDRIPKDLEFEFNINELPIFIWEIDPIELGDDGLEIITSDELQAMYPGGTEIYDEEALIDMFIENLHELAAM